VEAEYLGLAQEEYIILTKEAFWSKEYFEKLGTGEQRLATGVNGSGIPG
jgi:hypothetical protein